MPFLQQLSNRFESGLDMIHNQLLAIQERQIKLQERQIKLEERQIRLEARLAGRNN